MSSDLATVTFMCDQMRGGGDIAFRKMFGEYAIYCDAKVVALVCDNQLFVKPTVAGQAIIGRPPDAPPYTGAKPHYLIDAELDDGEWLSRLIAATARDLPLPKPRKPKKQTV
jgi:TfoX/Sxy family transcriptional regulator of competence genes